MVCPKFNSHVYKLKRVGHGEHICFYFAIGVVQRGASIGECPMFQFFYFFIFFGDGANQHGPFPPKKKEKWGKKKV